VVIAAIASPGGSCSALIPTWLCTIFTAFYFLVWTKLERCDAVSYLTQNFIGRRGGRWVGAQILSTVGYQKVPTAWVPDGFNFEVK
jgi:hypothetical protein